jgi:hypothetical protein
LPLRRFAKIAIALALVVSGFGAVSAAFLNFWPSFGGRVVGERKTRAQASPPVPRWSVRKRGAEDSANHPPILGLPQAASHGRRGADTAAALSFARSPRSNGLQEATHAGVAGNLVRACQRLSRNRPRPHHGRSDAVGVRITASRCRAEARFTSDRWHGSIEPLEVQAEHWEPAWKADAPAGTSGIG